MTTLAQRRQDTLDFLSEHGETLTLKQKIVTYDDDGKSNTGWSAGTEFSGDWQPLSGDMYLDEAGLRTKSNAQVVAVYNLAVNVGDRIYRADGTYGKVNYPRKFGDYIMIRLTVTEG